MSAEQNKDLAFRGLDAINRHDVAGLDAVFSPGWAVEIQSWFSTIDAVWTSHRMEMVDLIAADNRVWCRLRASGIHSGAWSGLPATGRPWTTTGIWFLRIAGGKIVEFEWLFDDFGLLRQLGATIALATRSVKDA